MHEPPRTSEPDSPAPEPAAPRRARFATAARVTAFVGIAGGLLWVVLPPSQAPFLAQVEALRAAGYATTHAENQGPPPRDEDNAAPELLAAWAELERQEGTQYEWKVTGPWNSQSQHPWHETATPEQLAELAIFLDRTEWFFNRVDAALTRPRLWFDEPEIWNPGPVVGVPLFQKTQRMLSARAEAHRSGPARLGACVTQLRLAERIEDRTTIDVMVAVAIRTGAEEAIRRLVDRRVVPAADVRAACDGLLRGSSVSSFPGAVRGEIALVAGLHAAIARGEVDPDELAEQMANTFAQLTGAKRAGWVSTVQDAVDGLFERSWLRPQEVADLLALERRVVETDTSDPTQWLGQVYSLTTAAPAVTMQFVIAFPLTAERLARADAAAAVTRCGLAVAEFRERQGRWPDTAEELRGAFPDGVPTDPFTGRGVTFERTAKGVRVASREAVPTSSEPGEEELLERSLAWELGGE